MNRRSGTGLNQRLPEICDRAARLPPVPRVQSYLEDLRDSAGRPQARRRPGLAREEPRIVLNFTPTGCSWLNLAEYFFSIIIAVTANPAFTDLRE